MAVEQQPLLRNLADDNILARRNGRIPRGEFKRFRERATDMAFSMLSNEENPIPQSVVRSAAKARKYDRLDGNADLEAALEELWDTLW